MAKRKKKRKNNYQPPRNKPPRVSYVPPSPVQSETKDEDEFWLVELVEFVKELLCGSPKKNQKPLTFGVFLRRSFIVLDNLIAATLVFYVLTWIKHYSNGSDTSFNVIIDDMSTLCFYNVMGVLLIIAVTWRRLYYSDSFPCLKNFTYQDPYDDFFWFIYGFSIIYFFYWIRLLLAYGLLKLITFFGISVDVDINIRSIYQYIEREHTSWYNQVPDYLPFWAQEIRIVILGVVFMIRQFCLNDIDMKYGRKIFEKKASKTQSAADAQENNEQLNGEETE